MIGRAVLLVALLLVNMTVALSTVDRRTRGEAVAFIASATGCGITAVVLASTLTGGP